MKKLRIFLNSCERRLEERWQKLSDRKQKKLVILFFAGYLLLTGCVVMIVWYDAKNETKINNAADGHIRNPVLKQQQGRSELKDLSLKPIKNQDHERQ
ncbi:hypothetical protein A0O34_07280 [Chryseobacterium glaciei]|uniref:Nitrogen regulatory IIA protein n=1 Tax=Chryseobacterium glaciei TaxID=1685010 RepID=A0A172XTH7_9FLAO|nr:hypothetical protein [Chryseobacterium glaciei]ANF50329.1 hypothetical protein A0O34_07280 [Chryseobacterium glaciei]